MPNPLFHQIARHAVLLKNRNAAMPKRMESASLEAKLSKNRMQFPPNVVLRKWRASSGMENAANRSGAHVLAKHFDESRFEMHYPVPALCLYRYFLAVPDATPYFQPAVLEFEVVHMETEDFSGA
jgi:hypothetical protein